MSFSLFTEQTKHELFYIINVSVLKFKYELEKYLYIKHNLM